LLLKTQNRMAGGRKRGGGHAGTCPKKSPFEAGGVGSEQMALGGEKAERFRGERQSLRRTGSMRSKQTKPRSNQNIREDGGKKEHEGNKHKGGV